MLQEIVGESEEEESSTYDLNNPDDLWTYLETNYNKIVNELEEDPTKLKYVEAYTMVFDYSYTMREAEKDITKQKEALEVAVNECKDRLGNSYDIINTDAQLINSLKQEVQKTHQLIDEVHGREQAAQEIIDNFRKTIRELNSEIEFKERMAQEDQEDKPRARHRQGIERENAKLIKEVSRLNDKLETALEYQEQLEHKVDNTDFQIESITDKLDDTNAELDRFKYKKSRLELDLHERITQIHNVNLQIEEFRKELIESQRVVVDMDVQVKEKTATTQKYAKEVDVWNVRFYKLKDECDKISYEKSKMFDESEVTRRKLRNLLDQQNRILADVSQRLKYCQQSDARLQAIAKDRLHMIKGREKERERLFDIEAQIDEQKLAIEGDKRNVENKKRENAILKHNLRTFSLTNKLNIKNIQLVEQANKKLYEEIESHQTEKNKQSKHIIYLERERDRMLDASMEKNELMEDNMYSLHVNKVKIYDLKKVLAEDFNRLRMQINLYEACRADRTALERSMHELSEQNQHLHAKFKVGTHSNEKVRLEIAVKQQYVLDAQADTEQVREQLRAMIETFQLWHKEIHIHKEKLLAWKKRERRTCQDLALRDRELRVKDKVVMTLMNERDVLAIQCVDRNNELVLLYSKLKLYSTMLKSGEKIYAARLRDIAILKCEVRHVRQQKMLQTKTITNMNDLRKEKFHMDRDFDLERLKHSRLEFVMHHSVNVHRWRRLEESEPDVYKMLQQIQILQKRVLQQQFNCQRIEIQFREINLLYSTLRKRVSKQAAPVIEDRLTTAIKVMEDSERHSRFLTGERNLLQIKFDESKIKLKEVNQELHDYKQKLIFETKSLKGSCKQISKIKFRQKAASKNIFKMAREALEPTNDQPI